MFSPVSDPWPQKFERGRGEQESRRARKLEEQESRKAEASAIATC